MEYKYISSCKPVEILEGGFRLGEAWCPQIHGDLFMPTHDSVFNPMASVPYEKAIILLKTLKNTYRGDKSFRIKVLIIAPEGHSSVYVLGGGK